MAATLLAHADRTRVMTEPIRRQVRQGAAVEVTVLVAGTVTATRTEDRTGVLTVVPLSSISAAGREPIEAEALRLLEFATPGTVHDVRFSGQPTDDPRLMERCGDAGEHSVCRRSASARPLSTGERILR